MTPVRHQSVTLGRTHGQNLPALLRSNYLFGKLRKSIVAQNGEYMEVDQALYYLSLKFKKNLRQFLAVMAVATT